MIGRMIGGREPERNFKFQISNSWEPIHAPRTMSSGQPQLDYDLAIIGGGSAGYAAARTGAGAGLRTVVIEGGKEIGGLCILRGCMPTKALLYAAEVRHLAQYGGLWGMKPGNVAFDWSAVMAHKEKLIR